MLSAARPDLYQLRGLVASSLVNLTAVFLNSKQCCKVRLNMHPGSLETLPVDCALVCSTGERTLNELKQRWVSAGRPELPDWETLLDGL